MKSFSRVTSFLSEYLLYLLLLLIPFSMRHVFDSAWNIRTGAYSDFTSLSLYLSDIVLIALIGFTVWSKPKWQLPKAWKITAIAAGVWLILELFIQTRYFFPLQVYFTIRILLLLIFAGIIANISVSREKLAWFFTGLGAFQGLIAVLQFYFQKSVGLFLLGESHLGQDMFGVAKIVSHGTKLIRAYGTFPHSNLLAAFLIISTLFNLYLLTKTSQSPRGKITPRGKIFTKYSALLYLTMFLNVFGVFLTFSRSGLLALVVAGTISLAYFLYLSGFSIVSRGIVPFIASIILSAVILFPYLTTRTTISDNAVKERVFYNQVGEKIVKDKPIFGIGPGTSVLHMKQYSTNASNTELRPWEIQPIHNYYLLSWAEWGLGSILLLFIIVFPIIGLIKTKKDSWSIILLSMSASFLVLFLFDHYFYTIWPTQLLLWFIIGLSLNKATYDTASSK